MPILNGWIGIWKLDRMGPDTSNTDWRICQTNLKLTALGLKYNITIIRAKKSYHLHPLSYLHCMHVAVQSWDLIEYTFNESSLL